jgi:hypothetical protein
MPRHAERYRGYVGSILQSLRPRPRPTTNVLVRRVGTLLLSVLGIVLSLALLFAALVPSKGNAVRPIGGVVASVGLVVSLWIGWYAISIPRKSRDKNPDQVQSSTQQSWPSVRGPIGDIADAPVDS